tara:strand:+ start:1020 stop:1271 length:252 start_codon:yes stop_codon:yes gene_type:complete
MKSEKIKEELNDIKVELAYMRGMMTNVNYQMQELREAIRESSNTDEELRVRELYEHPWYKYKRQELISSGNYREPFREDLSDI